MTSPHFLGFRASRTLRPSPPLVAVFIACVVGARPAPAQPAPSAAAPSAAAPSPAAREGRGAPQRTGDRPRLTKPPALLEFVEAAYPEEELANGRAATVVLQVAISAEGRVDDVTVVESAGPAFDEAARAAVQQFAFSPAEIDGKPAAVRITYRYEFTPRIEAPTTGNLRGVVLDKESGEPLAGVGVELEGPKLERPSAVVTDARGEFSFGDLPAGEVTVTLTRADSPPVRTTESVDAGRTLEVRYELELVPAPSEGAADDEDEDDFELVVLAPRLVKQSVSTEVSAEEARRVPGTQGDVLKVVENLPGVARASAGSGEVVVWGAAPQDTRTYVGAVRVPMLYHFGGLRSILHNDGVRSVELVPGGYGVAHGRGLGGLVRVALRDPAQDRLRGSAQIDLLDAAVAAAGPIDEKWSFAVSGRRSHIADAAGLLNDQSFQQFFTLPRYFDGQARLRRTIAQGEWVEFGALLSGDVQQRTQPSSDLSRRVAERRTLHFQRYDIAYRKQLADGAEVDLAPWYGRDRAGRYGAFGGVPTLAESESHLAGLRAEWRGKLGPELLARTGFDFELVHSLSRRSGSITSPPREGDPYVFGRAPADQVNFDEWKSTIASAAPYAEVDWAPWGDKLHFTPGVRVEPYLISLQRRRPANPNFPDLGLYQRDVSVQPRLAVRYAALEGLELEVAAGRYSQPPLADDLSAVFGNPALGLSRGSHLLGSAAYEVRKDVKVEVTVFHTRSERLAARNPAAAPNVAEALIQEGEGRSLGAQFLLRRDKGDGAFFGWLAYTILESERKDSATAAWRPFDYDQTHVLTALGSYDLGAGFEVGARVRLASGFPRTPVTGVYYDARRGTHEPLLGEYNSDRIPLFLQVDARGAKRFDLGGSELEIYLDVQNVTNRENPEEIAYAPDYSERRYVLGLPILPVLGARWSF